MRHCLNSDGILSCDDGWKKVSPELQWVPGRITRKATADRYWKNNILPRIFSVYTTHCEIRGLCLDPNSPFLMLKRGIIHPPPSRHGFKKEFKGGVWRIPTYPCPFFSTVSHMSSNCSPFGVILCLHHSCLCFLLHSLFSLHLPPASQHYWLCLCIHRWHSKMKLCFLPNIRAQNGRETTPLS